MARWLYHVKIKHLFVEQEDHASIQASMNAIANVLAGELCFSRFNTTKFRAIPAGDDVFGPVDYANRLLAGLYNYADDNRIWIE